MNDYPLVVCALSEDDGGGFAAFYPDLPGCMSDGGTPEEAVTNAQGAFASWMEIQEARGSEIPAPGDSGREVDHKIESLFNALKSVLDYAEHAEGRIQELEDHLSDLIQAMREDWRSSGALAAHAGRKAHQAISKH